MLKRVLLLTALAGLGCTVPLTPEPDGRAQEDVTQEAPDDADQDGDGDEGLPDDAAAHDGILLADGDPVEAWAEAAVAALREDAETAASFFYWTMHPDVRDSFRWCDTSWLHEAGVDWSADQRLQVDPRTARRASWTGTEGPLADRSFPDAVELPVTVLGADGTSASATVPFVVVDGRFVWLADCPPRPERDLPDLRPTREPAPQAQAEPPAPAPDPDETSGADPEPDEPDEPDTPAGPDLSVALTLTEVGQLDAVIAAATAPDGTMYLASREGTVHPLRNGVVGPAVVDVAAETRAVGEEGLLGIAFAPDGSELFVSYTTVSPRNSMIVAYPVQGGEVVSGQRRTVFTLPQPDYNHNGGDIKFGPDGMLYIALGDGSLHGDPHGFAQDLSTPLGSILRIDPLSSSPYAVPGDNPFVGVSGAAPEIWVYGLRNPWRFSFDQLTGDLWIGDVGETKREEINRIPAGQGGANLGWNLMEGWLEFAGPAPEDHVGPVWEYANTPSRCAVIGGHVYRGSAIPELYGVYLFSDFCEGVVRGLVVDNGAVLEQGTLGLDAGSVVSFAEDAAGELYVLRLATGVVYRIDPAG